MNDVPFATAKVDGHTDSVGTDASDLSLSDRRAKAVFDYLTSRGVDPSRLKSQGFGEADPIASNDTAEGRPAEPSRDAEPHGFLPELIDLQA